MILEVLIVVPSGVGKMSVCMFVCMYVGLEPRPFAWIKLIREVLCHYMVHGTDAEFKMDSLNRAGGRNFSKFLMGDCVLNETYLLRAG